MHTPPVNSFFLVSVSKSAATNSKSRWVVCPLKKFAQKLNCERQIKDAHMLRKVSISKELKFVKQTVYIICLESAIYPKN